MKIIKTKKIALSALFTTVIVACGWISLPTPFGINITLSILGVCLAAFVLGVKYALVSIVAYIALGAVGLPVFSQFMGGAGVLFGVSGGFIWGFLLTVVICGIAKKCKRKILKYVLMVVAVIVCHASGVVQYSLVSGNGLIASFLSASLPFLIKDVLLVFFANAIYKKIKV